MSILDIFARLERERTEKETAGRIEFIVAGLGNPGTRYENTRHNAGYMVLDKLSEKKGFRIDSAKFHALVGQGSIGSHRVLFMKPTTFMNASGEAIAEAARFYKIPVENIVVISDDISLAVGKIRIRRKGSHGGHNGLKSVEAQLGSSLYPRIKIGVGEKPHPDYDLADWVLGKFSTEDKKALGAPLEKAGEALEYILDGKFDDAMCKFN